MNAAAHVHGGTASFRLMIYFPKVQRRDGMRRVQLEDTRAVNDEQFNLDAQADGVGFAQRRRVWKRRGDLAAEQLVPTAVRASSASPPLVIPQRNNEPMHV